MANVIHQLLVLIKESFEQNKKKIIPSKIITFKSCHKYKDLVEAKQHKMGKHADVDFNLYLKKIS